MSGERAHPASHGERETTDAETESTGGTTTDGTTTDGTTTDGTTAEDTTTDGPATNGKTVPSESEPVESGAQSVVRALENAGVECLFGVQGGAIMPVYDALYHSELTHITMAHEQGAAHAADAYGIVTGEPGVCMATSGPGATNLVTGIADANMDSDPLIALTGQVPVDFVGNDAFQETDTVGVTMPITKNNYFAGDADTVGDDVGEAFALAREGRQGPTLVDLPKDVTQADTDREPAAAATPDTYDPPDRADADAVEAAAEALATAERPIILAGGGVIKGEASPELRAFARDHEIPVVTTMPALGAFPEDDDLAMSFAGMHGTGYANMAITLCDVMFAVGTRFDDRLTGDLETFAPDAEIVHADIDPSEISKNVHADYPLVGDAGTVIEQVAETMPSVDPDQYGAWREQCREWKDEYPMDYERPEDGPVKPQHVVERYDAATADDTIVTTGVGQHQMWACQYWTFTEPRTWVSSHGLGAMGYGVPATIGARIAADDDQDVVCFDGDGSFLMTLQELAVAVREDLDVTIVVLNNEAIGMVCQWQDAFYGERRMASEYPWVPEFDTVAEAFGARGFRIEDSDDVDRVVEESLAYDGPSVVDVYIDPTERVYPMVPSGGDNGRFALSEQQLEQL